MAYLPEDCSFKFEQSLTDLLSSLNNHFMAHLALFRASLLDQINILDSMHVLSQRFLILTRGAICVRPYPRELSKREETETASQFEAKKKLLRVSNSKLESSIAELKEKCYAFDRCLARIDLELPSPIVEGNKQRQPIHYFIELYADINKFFLEYQNKLKLLGNFLMVEDIGSILEYESLLKPDQTVMDYFESSLDSLIN